MAYSYKCSISFGLVYIPVTLHASVKTQDVGFNMLDKKTMSRVKYKKTCEECDGREVKQEDIVKGYEYEDDKYVVFTEEDFEKLKTKKDKNITIQKFVDIAEIDPIYYDRPYYVNPTGAENAYSLLLRAMEEEKKVGIAKTVLGNKETLIALRAKDGQATLRNKRNKDVTDIYPELSEIWRTAYQRCILDGELVAFTDGKPDFYALQKRSLMTDGFRIGIAAKRNPVQFVAYDILYVGKKRITDKTQEERKKILSDTVRDGENLSVSRWIEGKGKDFFALTKRQGLEGIVAKRKDGKYHIGKRTRDWIKIKVMQDEDLLICGYQPDENGDVKDLVLGYKDENGKLKNRGKVYLGVSKEDKKIVREFAKKNTVARALFDKYKNVVWLKPELVGTAHFMQETENGTMRQPVFKGIRDDK